MLTTTPRNTEPLIPPTERPARCPGCGKLTRFRFTGEQRWPQRVAEAAGIEPVVRLWTCQTCRTTISETDLH